jgi:hypothetical protein
MSDIRNGVAYPTGTEYMSWPIDGMSLRDWFAGQALAGVRAPSDYSSGPCNAAIAERAYAIADAMIRVRGEK